MRSMGGIERSETVLEQMPERSGALNGRKNDGKFGAAQFGAAV
jgi:hypothetical protein